MAALEHLLGSMLVIVLVDVDDTTAVFSVVIWALAIMLHKGSIGINGRIRGINLPN